MDVAVRFKPGHRRLRSRQKPSVLGSGLLERVRSTTLALLGVTTAVGLAMVALALNQSWPLVADSPLPLPPRQEAVGEATVAAGAIAGGLRPTTALSSSPPASDRSRSAPDGDRGAANAPEGGAAPVASTELIVAPSAPAGPKEGDVPQDAGSPSSPPPAVQSPSGSAPAAPASGPAQPAPLPQAPPPVETSPPPTSAEVPVDPSSDDDWDDDGDDWDDDWDDDDWDDGDWDDHDHDHGRGHHWSRGRHDD